jgi:hypothetical protein
MGSHQTNIVRKMVISKESKVGISALFQLNLVFCGVAGMEKSRLFHKSCRDFKGKQTSC